MVFIFPSPLPPPPLSLSGQWCKSLLWFCFVLVFAVESSDLQRCWQMKVRVPTANLVRQEPDRSGAAAFSVESWGNAQAGRVRHR